jgi:hypothetical protein
VSNWKKQAEALFFTDHLGITAIATIIRKSRKSVSEHINGCDGYEAEMEFRREGSAEKRKEYRRQWDRANRSGRYTTVTAESLRNEHETAVRILSKERFFHG